MNHALLAVAAAFNGPAQLVAEGEPGGESISVEPNTTGVAISASGTADIVVTLTRLGGYTGDVTLVTTGLPTGVAASYPDGSAIFSGATTTRTVRLTGTAAGLVSDDPFVITASGVGVDDDFINCTITVAADHAIYTNAPLIADGWTEVFDWGCDFVPPASGNTDGWTAFERPGEGTVNTNLSIVTDATQPNGGVNSNALRFNFPAGLLVGYAPALCFWQGGWPTNAGYAHFGYTIRLSSNWTDAGATGPQGAGSKNIFWGSPTGGSPAQNHTMVMSPQGNVGTPRQLLIASQNPFASYLTGAAPVKDNAWHIVEFRVFMGSPGNTDGTLEMWFDGVKVLIGNGAYGTPDQYVRTVKLLDASHTAAIGKYYWEPTWASIPASSAVVDTDIQLDVGSMFCRVK